ncbi:MAG: CvpA family protein [Aeromonas sp.]
MVWIDYAIIGIVGFSALISLTRGFVKEAMSLVTWGIAVLVASRFYPDLAVFFTTFADPMVRNGMAIAALFVATLIIGGIVNNMMGVLVEKTGLSGTDRVLGVCFGAIRGVLIVSALLFFMDTFTSAAQSEWWATSKLVPEFKPVIQWFFGFMQHSSSVLKQVQ